VANLPHVAVVGGGFGGLYAAQALAARQVRVTLLDQRNHHLFQPLLYQVATAALNASDIAAPLRSILRRAHNVTVLLAEVARVDLAAHRRLPQSLPRAVRVGLGLRLVAARRPTDHGPVEGTQLKRNVTSLTRRLG